MVLVRCYGGDVRGANDNKDISDHERSLARFNLFSVSAAWRMESLIEAIERYGTMKSDSHPPSMLRSTTNRENDTRGIFYIPLLPSRYNFHEHTSVILLLDLCYSGPRTMIDVLSSRSWDFGITSWYQVPGVNPQAGHICIILQAQASVLMMYNFI